ncbi:MAG: dual specificity protein phosphatase family protein [Candidatus Azobacteroides sp.]|nr:dual specificity protein phosphatase family protein [Candidatus Azobacteroides sp.]
MSWLVTNKRNILFLWVLLFLIDGYGQQYYAEEINLPGTILKNFYRIDEDVYRSGQPSGKAFHALENLGIKEVLNLRSRHNDKDEAKGTGIILHHIRINAHSISEAHLLEAMRIIKNRTGPILIHCWHGSDRTGAVIATYRMVFQLIPAEEAIEEMKEGGFGHHRIFSNIVKTLRKLNVENIRQELGLENELN